MNRNSRITGDQSGRVYIDGKYLDPIKSQSIWNHSPDGFSYGYCGSGCAQFALALLLEATTKQEAVKWYQYFKIDCISTFPHNKDLDTSAEFIYAWLENKRKEVLPKTLIGTTEW
jgi:hypothetical protein